MKKILMIIVLILCFISCGDAKYKDFSDEIVGKKTFTANEIVYTSSIVGWVTDDNANLVVSIPLVHGSGANKIEEYYIKPITNSRGEQADLLVIKLKRE